MHQQKITQSKRRAQQRYAALLNPEQMSEDVAGLQLPPLQGNSMQTMTGNSQSLPKCQPKSKR